jgi:hypothetical protein
MNRATIVATIVASILSLPSLSLAASDAEIGGLGNKMSYQLVRLRIVDPSTLQTMALSLNDDLQLAGRNEMTRRHIYCPTPR